jgi:hypothetical protein
MGWGCCAYGWQFYILVSQEKGDRRTKGQLLEIQDMIKKSRENVPQATGGDLWVSGLCDKNTCRNVALSYRAAHDN